MPRQSDPRERPLTAIPWIVRRFKPTVAAAVFAVAALASFDAAAGSRVTVLGFEGDRATPIRWRVAQILKRAGHTVLGFKPPRDPESASELSAYAERRRVDAFVAGSAVEGEEGWTLSLAVRGSNGARLGKPLTFTAPTLGALVQELKGDGQERLDRAVTRSAAGAAAEAPSEEDGSDAAAELDADEPAPKPAAKKKKKKKRKSRKSRRAEPAPEPDAPPAAQEIDLDGASDSEAEAPPAEPPAEDVDAWGRDSGTRGAKKRAKARESEDAEPVATDVNLDGATSTTEASSSSDEGTAIEPEPAPSEADSEERAESEALAAPESDSDENSSPLASGDGEAVGVDEGSTGSEKSAGASRWPTLILGAGAGVVYRKLSYVDNLYGRLRSPTTNSVSYKLDALLYPFARPVKDRLALVASYEATFSGDVKDANLGKSFAVEFSEIAGGIRYRQPLGAHEMSAQTTIGRLSSGLTDPNKESRIPGIDYTIVRPSVELGLNFGDISVRGSLGYRLTIGGFGEVSEVEYFPRMAGYGVDAQGGLRYRFSDEVSFDLSGDMRRFVLNMNSVPDDAIEGRSEVAGGAVDLYLSGYFALALTF